MTPTPIPAPPPGKPQDPVTVDDLLEALEVVTRSADEAADAAKRAVADVEAQGRRNAAQARQIVQLEGALRRARGDVEALTAREASLVGELAAARAQLASIHAAQVAAIRPGGSLPRLPVFEADGGAEAFVPNAAGKVVRGGADLRLMAGEPGPVETRLVSGGEEPGPNMCDRPGCGHPRLLHTFDGCIDRCSCHAYKAPVKR